MSVAHSKVVAAYQYFLGRDPNPEKPPVFASMSALHQTLLESLEFRASPRANKNRLTWPLKQHFVSQRARAIYCPIAKNGCTFIKRQMVFSSDVEHCDYITNHDVHTLTDYVCTGIQLGDYSEAEAAHFLASPDYYRFAVIRDPVDRLISAYMEKFVLNRNRPRNWAHTKPVVSHVQNAAGLEAPNMDRGISFREFVEYVVSRAPDTLDPHWCPQYLYLEGVHWNRIYKMSELMHVTDMLEDRSGRVLPRKAVNITGNLGDTFLEGGDNLLPAEIAASPPLSVDSYLETGLREVIEDYYAVDIQLLNENQRM